ncbi:carbamate kinase [Acidipropionibacterium timonense]|uniref:carbamate kinase n=1 Tax=Acidipropionibacterium timonense TaxID=2161818 RepID=UPI0010321F9A|nr:carbamate kinase [Acidipropionibacterium timonense]
MRIVVALGGNALLERGERPDASTQVARAREAVRCLAPLAEEHELVITHGNGPQVGLLAQESSADPTLSAPYGFDTLGAATQGMIGYWLVQALQNELPGRQVLGLLNQTLVLAHDPAFENPTKYVGPVYTKEEAEAVAADKGWTMRQDGNHWRRVVGSPKPQRVVETRIIRRLLSDGVIVVCAGGGGVPVIRDSRGKLTGVEAVLDKDRTAARLAIELDADALLVLTDVPAIMADYGTDHARAINRATPDDLWRMDFPDGSMGPKVEACCTFVELTGDMAAIGRLQDAPALLQGTTGTIITPGGDYGGPEDLTPRHFLRTRAF